MLRENTQVHGLKIRNFGENPSLWQDFNAVSRFVNDNLAGWAITGNYWFSLECGETGRICFTCITKPNALKIG
jgi:hypothetical protein